MTIIEEIENSDFFPTTCTCDVEGEQAQIYYRNQRDISVKRTVWIDTATNDCYRNDSSQTLSVKCLLIFIVTPVYLAFHTVWHIARIPVRLGWVIYESYEILLKEKSICSISMAAGNIVFGLPYEFLLNICEVVKSAFYALGIEIFAVLGLVAPLYARMQIASIERKWHEGRSTQDIRYNGGEETCKEYIKNGFWEKESQHAIFIAYCFQPIRNLDRDPIDRLDRHRFSVSASLPNETLKLAFSGSQPQLSKE